MSEQTDVHKKSIKISPTTIRTLKLFEYKGFHVMLQAAGYIFQYVIFKDGQWRTSFVTDLDTQDTLCKDCNLASYIEYSDFEMVRITSYIEDMAKATIDVVLDPDILDKHEKEEVIVDVLEDNAGIKKEKVGDAVN